MAEQWLADDKPATALFPQFESQLYQMTTTEVRGLTERQLDWLSDRWEWSKWSKWSKWSIRRQVSHMGLFVPNWLVRRWGEQLFPHGLSGLGDLAEWTQSPDGPWLDQDMYRDMPALLEKVDHGMRLAQYILARETVGSLRLKELFLPNTPASWALSSQAHPTGFRRDPTDPTSSYITLEATLRHLYFEAITHIYNIQRLKRAHGLTASVEIPFEGYYALPDWDRSEP